MATCRLWRVVLVLSPLAFVACGDAGKSSRGSQAEAAAAASAGGYQTENDVATHDQPSAPPQSADAEGEGAVDVPVWINGAFLTCNWGRSEARLEVEVECALADPRGAAQPSAAADTVTWAVVDSTGHEHFVRQRRVPGNPFAVVLTFRKFEVAGLSVQARVAGGAIVGAARDFAVALDDELPGLSSGDIVACLADGSRSGQECVDLAMPDDAETGVTKGRLGEETSQTRP